MAALNDPNCAELMAQALEIQVKSLNDQIALLRGYVPPAAVVAEVEDGGKKKRKKKDPNRPKRSHSAYQLFIMDALPKLKQEHPTLTQRDLMSMGAKQWATCPSKKKEELEKVAAKEKVEYIEVLANYEAGLAAGGGSSSAVPVVKVRKPRAKKVVATPVVPAEVPVVPTPPVVVVEEKKRKKEKKSKKESSGEESAKKKKKSK